MSSHCFLEGTNIHHYAFVEGAIILPCQLLGGQMSTHAIFHRSGSSSFTIKIYGRADSEWRFAGGPMSGFYMLTGMIVGSWFLVLVCQSSQCRNVS